MPSKFKAVSFGAEALSPHAEEEAEDKDWKLAKYFKLHLHPADLTAKHGLELERKWFETFQWMLKHCALI